MANLSVKRLEQMVLTIQREIRLRTVQGSKNYDGPVRGSLLTAGEALLDALDILDPLEKKEVDWSLMKE